MKLLLEINFCNNTRKSGNIYHIKKTKYIPLNFRRDSY